MKYSRYNIIKKYKDRTIIYNSFTKSSIIVDKNENLDFFEDDSSIKKLDKDTKRILRENGFIIEDHKDELQELEYYFKKRYYDNDFHNIILVPTMSCNFSCPYCFEKGHEMNKIDFQTYFDAVKKYSLKYFNKHKVIQISLFGGEPLLYYKYALDYLEVIGKDSKDKGYDFFVSMVTNGSLLNKNIFINLLKKNLKFMQITIDSDKKTHDITRKFINGRPSFDVLINNINNLIPLSYKYKDFKFLLRINLNNTTPEKVEDSIKEINVDVREKIRIMFRVVYNTKVYNEKNTNDIFYLEEYYKMAKKLNFKIETEKFDFQTCEACGDLKGFYILPDLSIWKCINDLDCKSAIIGKITKSGNLKIDSQNLVNWYKNCTNQFGNKECIRCKMLPDCLGGCPLYKIKHKEKQCRSFDMLSLPYIYEE